jgi:DNA-binding HxlR family transcriptional regulator
VPTSRSYADACGIARALDVVGERWALLLVRELLLAPQRALPGASSNLVSDRLRELTGHGVLRRRRAAASWVYELTPRGRELEPIVLALGSWGVRAAMPAGPATLSATSVLLFLRAAARPDPAEQPATYRLELDGRVWTVHLDGDGVTLQPGEPTGADASLRTDPQTLNALLTDPAALDATLAAGDVGVAGDVASLRRLLRAVTEPYPR